MQTRKLALPGERGLVSLSGGSDSMALLHLLKAIADRLNLGLEVIHFDHGIRPESAQEAIWAADQVTALGLPFHLRTTTQLGGRTTGVPALAREWRLLECRKVVEREKLDWVATGHQQDDQWETLLLKFVRGCHISHLGGMTWRSEKFIRPLLDIPRAELSDYLCHKGVSWLEDPSNSQLHYLRNRIRHQLLPLLEELTNGKIGQRLANLGRQSGQLESLLETYPQPTQNDPTRPPHWMSLPELKELPEIVAEGILSRFIQKRLAGELNSLAMKRVGELIRSPKIAWSLDLSGERTLQRKGDRLVLERKSRSLDSGQSSEIVAVGRRQIIVPKIWPMTAHEGPCPEHDGMEVFNLPSGASLSLRPRLPGDRFHPPWRERSKKIKDFLRDQRVPLWERDQLPLLVLDNQVIAIYPDYLARGYDSPHSRESVLCLHMSGPDQPG